METVSEETDTPWNLHSSARRDALSGTPTLVGGARSALRIAAWKDSWLAAAELS
jgi:hypothetical protein